MYCIYYVIDLPDSSSNVNLFANNAWLDIMDREIGLLRN